MKEDRGEQRKSEAVRDKIVIKECENEARKNHSLSTCELVTHNFDMPIHSITFENMTMQY